MMESFICKASVRKFSRSNAASLRENKGLQLLEFRMHISNRSVSDKGFR